MAKLIPATGFLYLNNSSLDLYLKVLREAVQSIPEGVLQLEKDSFPVITDISFLKESPFYNISLGLGSHQSYFHRHDISPAPSGLALCLNPPYVKDVKDVVMFQKDGGWRNHSNFVIGDNRFILTPREIDLDVIVCGDLSTGTIYKASEKYLK